MHTIDCSAIVSDREHHFPVFPLERKEKPIAILSLVVRYQQTIICYLCTQYPSRNKPT